MILPTKTWTFPTLSTGSSETVVGFLIEREPDLKGDYRPSTRWSRWSRRSATRKRWLKAVNSLNGHGPETLPRPSLFK
jgi:hypothetical protein